MNLYIYFFFILGAKNRWRPSHAANQFRGRYLAYNPRQIFSVTKKKKKEKKFLDSLFTLTDGMILTGQLTHSILRNMHSPHIRVYILHLNSGSLYYTYYTCPARAVDHLAHSFPQRCVPVRRLFTRANTSYLNAIYTQTKANGMCV